MSPNQQRAAVRCRSIRPARYDLQSTEHAANLFALQEVGNIYTRISNPTSNVLEKRIADLENGVGAVEVSSGHAAQAKAIFTICEVGDHIVAASTFIWRDNKSIQVHVSSPGDQRDVRGPV